MKVIAPEMVRIFFLSKSQKRKFSNGYSLTIYFGGRKVELVSTRNYIIGPEYDDSVSETVDFMIPYEVFKELVKEGNIKMLLGAEEFKLPGWIRGQFRNAVRMVEN